MGYLLSKKALRTIHFKGKFDHNSSLFSETNMIKFSEKMPIENCLFVSKSLNNQFPEIFNNKIFNIYVHPTFFRRMHIDMKHHGLRNVSLK